MTASRWRATTRSRPTSCPARWPHAIPAKVNGLHMLISSVSRPRAPRPVRAEHRRQARPRLRGTAERPHRADASRTAQVKIGAIHTYVELYARMFIDLRARRRAAVRIGRRPRRQSVHRPNTEDTPTIAEAAAFRDGVVLVQADEIVGRAASCPASTSPATGSTSWSRPTGRSRSSRCSPAIPRLIGPVEILKAMIAHPRHLRASPGDVAQPRRSGSTLRQSN